MDKGFWADYGLATAFVVTLVAIIFTRYWLVAYLYKSLMTAITGSKRNLYKLRRMQIDREIKWSFLSSIIAAGVSAICFWMYQLGYTKIYSEMDTYSNWYFWISPLILLFLYETYYYWLHRLMHVPRIFRIVHKVHHESKSPTVFTSFSFHPLEAILQFIFFPLVIVLIPLHYSVLFIVFTLMTLSAVVNHSGVEIMKSRFLLKHLIGSSHHDLHHAKFQANFGLYFTWWDRWMKTEAESKNKPVHR